MFKRTGTVQLVAEYHKVKTGINDPHQTCRQSYANLVNINSKRIGPSFSCTSKTVNYKQWTMKIFCPSNI